MNALEILLWRSLLLPLMPTPVPLCCQCSAAYIGHNFTSRDDNDDDETTVVMTMVMTMMMTSAAGTERQALPIPSTPAA